MLSERLGLRAADWRPVTPAELSLKQSKIDSDADAEGLFRDMRVLNEASMRAPGSDEEKITRLAQYCRNNIKNVRRDEITTKERAQLKENHTTLDTLRQKEGTPEDINLAFAALAIGAGFAAPRRS